MPESTPENDAFAHILGLELGGATVRESFMIHDLHEPTEDFMNSLIEPQHDWSTGPHPNPSGHHSTAFMLQPPTAPCTGFSKQQRSWRMASTQEPCADPGSPLIPTSQPKVLVRSCRARRAPSGGLGANTLQAAWRCKTVKCSSTTQHQHSLVPAASAASPHHLDSCTLWDSNGAGILEHGLQGPETDNSGAAMKPRHTSQPYDLELDDFFPVSMSRATSGEELQDHIFTDCCFRTDESESLEASAAHHALLPELVKPQPTPPPSAASDDEFCAMLFEHAPSLTSSEASLAFCPSEHDQPQCSGSCKRSNSTLGPDFSIMEQNKKICLDLGLQQGQDMLHIQNGLSTAPLKVSVRPALPPPLPSPRKVQAAKDGKSTAGRGVAAAAAHAPSPRGKPAYRAEIIGTGSEAGRGAQAKRRQAHAPASKPHRAQPARGDAEGPRGPSSPSFAAVQALLEWQALSHRVVTAAASLNQARAWSMLTDNELAHFLAKMGKATIVSSAGDGADSTRRACLIHGIKQVVGSARLGKATAAEGTA